MSDKITILDKLKDYEKTGHYDGAVEDIYALIHHAADLEDELRAARAFTPRDNAGGTASRGAVDGTVAIDAYGCAWARVDPGCWFPLRIDVDSEVIELPESGGPYTIVYIPGGRIMAPTAPKLEDIPAQVDDVRLAKEITVSGSGIFVDGDRFPWFVRENPQVVPFDDGLVALQIFILAERVTVPSNTEQQ